jgi:hypothetical protein
MVVHAEGTTCKFATTFCDELGLEGDYSNEISYTTSGAIELPTLNVNVERGGD